MLDAAGLEDKGSSVIFVVKQAARTMAFCDGER